MTPTATSCSRRPLPIAREKQGSALRIQFLKGVTDGERGLRRRPMSDDQEQLVCQITPAFQEVGGRAGVMRGGSQLLWKESQEHFPLAFLALTVPVNTAPVLTPLRSAQLCAITAGFSTSRRASSLQLCNHILRAHSACVLCETALQVPQKYRGDNMALLLLECVLQKFTCQKQHTNSYVNGI